MIEKIIRRGYENHIIRGEEQKSSKTFISKSKNRHYRKLFYTRDSKCVCAEIHTNGKCIRTIGSKIDETIKYVVTLSADRNFLNLMTVQTLSNNMMSFRYTCDIFNFRRVMSLDFDIKKLEKLRFGKYVVEVVDIQFN